MCRLAPRVAEWLSSCYGNELRVSESRLAGASKSEIGAMLHNDVFCLPNYEKTTKLRKRAERPLTYANLVCPNHTIRTRS